MICSSHQKMVELTGGNSAVTLPLALTKTKDYFVMANRLNITPELCRQLLHYDQKTGKLFWKERPFSSFRGPTRVSVYASWNRRFAGKEAFKQVSRLGYLTGAIMGVSSISHRVIWAIVYGEWPSGEIDHLNGDKQDNRIANLRDCKHVDNHKNMPMRRDNKSGVTGVYWCKHQRKWIAHIRADRRRICLGSYLDFGDAVAARSAAEVKYGFEERHGKEKKAVPAQYDMIAGGVK